MRYRSWIPALALVTTATLGGAGTASAQGLLWNLPEEGTWVRYEGTYQHEEFQPGTVEGKVTLQWTRHLTVKSLESEPAEYQGETVPCRWIEFKLVTGEPREGVLDPGPVGTKLYLVLVPESRVIGRVRDADDIPVSFIPVVRGYRQVGDGPVQPTDSNVLQVYPSLSLLMHHKALEEDGTEDADVPAGTLTARKLQGRTVMESSTGRSTNETTLWVSDEAPFGVVQWEVRVHREVRHEVDPRSAFQPASEAVEQMSAHEFGTDAQAELIVP